MQKRLTPSNLKQETKVVTNYPPIVTMTSFSTWHIIKPKLLDIAAGSLNEDGTTQVLTNFHNLSQPAYKGKYQLKGALDALSETYGQQIPGIFAKIAKFVIEAPNYSYPALKVNSRMQCTLSKKSILYVICSMALLLGPQTNDREDGRMRLATINDFYHIFRHNQYKTQTIIEYLKKQLDSPQNWKQKMTIKRCQYSVKTKDLIEESKVVMGELYLQSDQKSIEDFFGDLKVDFANRVLGGGSLTGGSLQQEIMFANHPELFVAQLLCEPMKENEAILMIGFRKYSSNKGYASKTQYTGPETHQYFLDDMNRADEHIIAIDAVHYHEDSFTQYCKKSIDREILKAYVGFKASTKKRIVTGNWGCGAFNGDKHLKLLIQWIACSLAGKNMVFCPFGWGKELSNYWNLIDKLKIKKISKVYNLLLDLEPIVKKMYINRSPSDKEFSIEYLSKIQQILKQEVKVQ